MKTIFTLLFTLSTLISIGQPSNYLPDESIELALINRLYMSQEVDADDASISVDNGTALLDGKVSTFYEKKKARQIAGTTKGVDSVIDELVVVTPLKSDRELKTDIKGALIIDPATNSYEIDVNVDKGSVSLFGKVSSLAEIRLAQDVVEGVEGVRKIKNNLTLNLEEQRRDIDIEQDVIGLISSDVRIAPKDLKVDVDQGEVKLEAKVGTPYERDVLVQLSEVEGVRSVSTEQVQVDAKYNQYWTKEPSSYVEMKDEENLVKAIERVFDQDPKLKNAVIEVEAEDGNVTLSGDVEYVGLSQEAEDHVWNVIGVKTLDNLILVENSEKEEKAIRDEVIDALASNPLLETNGMDVSVKGGIVTLFGAVSNNFMRYVAESEASGVEGVEAVENELISDQNTGFFSGSISYQVDTSNMTKVNPRQSDSMIEQNIRYQFSWSPYIVPENLELEVVDGVAIISGYVSDQRQRREIISNAYQAGAVAVVSDLNF